MKKMKLFTTYIIAVFLFIGTLYAQTPKWVSTEVQNRVAVFEYFTGIYCQGSRLYQNYANERAKEHSNELIIVNNHCGYYAAPREGSHHLDLRTEEGYFISLEAGIEKFPQGSINRASIPWAVNLNNYQFKIDNIVTQKSVVNVYANSKLNYDTRELTVEVEYYYTLGSLSPENYLTVMLLQNDIITYQASGREYDHYIMDDSLYHHMHVLRKIISDGDFWGDTITNTTKGTYGCRKYTVILPDSINNVPLDLKNLEIVAFIAESKSNIYTAHKAVVDVPDNISTDLTLEDITEYNKTYKFETIYPKIKVTNNKDVPVTKFDVVYSFMNSQGIIRDTNTFSGVLNKGESAIFEFKEVTKAEFKVGSTYFAESYISSIFSDETELLDINKEDNNIKIKKLALFEKAFNEKRMNFENSNPISEGDFIPPHSVLDDFDNIFFGVQSIITPCGAKNTNNAMSFSLGDPSIKTGYIVFGEVDCQDNPQKILSYYYAYSNNINKGTSPKIITEISTDWGQTWKRISEINCDQTAESQFHYTPKSDEYRFVQIDLSNYTQENFIIRVGGSSGTADGFLYIDEVYLTNVGNDGDSDSDGDGGYIEAEIDAVVYPNPTSNILYISNDKLLGEEYEIYDLSGNLIINNKNNTNIINVENISIGSYYLKIKGSYFNFIKK
ncbi:MAG: Omp28-related outer membrane protein [Bacteroidetes bacterium]|nr:Omp28-related outer membrane protein [Bacteroidota bacterium]